MNHRLATQATALGLAFIATLTLMGGIHQLAAAADAQGMLAAAAKLSLIHISEPTRPY